MQVWIHAWGLVELLQMASYDTYYSLEKNNFLHQKNCTDCKKSIGELFQTLNCKVLLYYCMEDYKVAVELEDTNTEIAGNACAYILCIPYYFGREAKQKVVQERKSTRKLRLPARY
jgi:hypothetical protein